MRLLTSTRLIPIVMVDLAACSGNTVTTPGAPVPSATVSKAPLPSFDAQSSASGHSIGKPGYETVALRTAATGNYVTAAGLSITEPNCGSGQVALHDDATKIDPREEFTLIPE